METNEAEGSFLKSRNWLKLAALLLFFVFCADSGMAYLQNEEVQLEEGQYVLKAVKGSYPCAAIRTFSYKGRREAGEEALDYYRVEAAGKNKNPLVLIVEVTVNPETSEPKKAHVKKL
ncbi:DUF3889 domain-containing protein [Bacillus mangrovi]|uniref:DUF3889 domain-containing protein n=1 Tax=Metabacillus mangrovi TaxID=1491830 RepID=A0A7X2S558_9BACI|nr:DUF3889 domain-containing protein [Metabacillus mangrovi]MTH53426.1 DUF3889 domain-containing protein [Metabacillus mangrovi]